MVKTSLGEYLIGGIYQHYKGNLYMIDNVGFLHDSTNIFLIVYHQCTIDGVFVSIREKLSDGKEKIIHQPFITHETRWNDIVTNQNNEKVVRFKLIKTK